MTDFASTSSKYGLNTPLTVVFVNRPTCFSHRKGIYFPCGRGIVSKELYY